MPLSKLQFKPGINKEITKYSNEAGWNDCDKVRFRQGYPEKIGGWRRYGSNTFVGVCRSIHQWVSNSFVKYIGLGTNAKFYVEEGTIYYDITPARKSGSIGASSVSPQNGYIATTSGEKQVSIFDAGHGAEAGDTVEFSGITGGPYNGIPIGDLNTEHTIDAVVDVNRYKVTVATAADASSTVELQPNNGNIQATYMLTVGPDFQIPANGWESADWGAAGDSSNTWNGNAGNIEELRVWNQANYGEDLIIGPRGGELYYWDTGSATFDSAAKTATRAVTVKDVKNGAPVNLTKTSTGTILESVPYITAIDPAVGATIRVGAVVTCTTANRIAAGTVVVSVSTNNAVVNLNQNPINTGINPIQGLTYNFDNNPISVTENSRTITVFDATSERVYESGQHVTLAGATGVSTIVADKINARHKIATVDSASNTYTIDIANAEPASQSLSEGGGASVTAQYEVSAEVPVIQNNLLVSDASRFVFCFGCNAFGDATETLNPMLIRWSDQEDMFDWRPRSTNQAGDIQLSQGTEIVTTLQSRQEILVFTDAALYSLQYVGAPVVWSSQLMGSNMSVISSKAAAYANGVAYWMGVGKFYKYDGAVQPLRCDVRKFIFDDMNEGQQKQVFAGSLEEYHEIWWFYVSKSNTAKVAPDKYVVYNYAEDTWYMGTLDRSAWLDSPINDFPLAATNTFNLVEHENGTDDAQNETTKPIDAHITSGQFGIESGNSFAFVDKLIPDMQFLGSDTASPTADITLLASSEPGSSDNDPLSEGGNSSAEILSSNAVDQYTDQLDIRVRGRQMAIKISSNSEGTRWQLGTPRINMRPDGRRGS